MTWSATLGTALPAQVERQVTFDAAGRVLVLTLEQARRLGADSLLPTVEPGYRFIRLFERPDSSFVLEFVYGTGELERRARVAAPPSLVAQLRAATGAGRVTTQRERRFQEGRAKLIRNHIIMGLGFYGWALPTALDIDNPRGAASLYLLTSAATFFVPFTATRTADVTQAQANLSWYGATRGLGVGLLVADLVDPNAGDRQPIGFALTGSLAGSVLGAVSGGRSRPLGEVSSMSAYGDLGALAGMSLAFTTGLYGGTGDHRAGHWAVLGGWGAGLAVGPRIARREAYGDGDPQVIWNAGLLGMAAATTALTATDADDDHVIGASLLAGEVVGALVGNGLARPVTLTEGQGTITTLAMLGGGLLGSGLAYLAAGNDAEPEVYIGTATVGGAAAMLLVLRSYRSDATRSGARRAPPVTVALGPGFVRLEF